jgi:uncharacterized protein (DUF1800 family)
VTSEFVGVKLYRHLVREEVSPEMRVRLGQLLREKNYDIGAFLEVLFASKDFYSDASVGTRIKPRWSWPCPRTASSA